MPPLITPPSSRRRRSTSRKKTVSERFHLTRKRKWMLVIGALLAVGLAFLVMLQLFLPDECLPPHCVPDD